MDINPATLAYHHRRLDARTPSPFRSLSLEENGNTFSHLPPLCLFSFKGFFYFHRVISYGEMVSLGLVSFRVFRSLSSLKHSQIRPRTHARTIRRVPERERERGRNVIRTCSESEHACRKSQPYEVISPLVTLHSRPPSSLRRTYIGDPAT